MSDLYPKVSVPFSRDSSTLKLTREWISPELEGLAEAPIWMLTEKVDGTNIRIIWDGYRVSIGGRTNDAEIPLSLMTYLLSRFGGPDNEELFETKFGGIPTILYGEGFGPGIRGGGKYVKSHSFVLFDVKIDGLFLLPGSVQNIAEHFDIPSIPVLAMDATLQKGIDLVSAGLKSTWGDFMAEGLVATTTMGLLDRRGRRIGVKIKTRDFWTSNV